MLIIWHSFLLFCCQELMLLSTVSYFKTYHIGPKDSLYPRCCNIFTEFYKRTIFLTDNLTTIIIVFLRLDIYFRSRWLVKSGWCLSDSQRLEYMINTIGISRIIVILHGQFNSNWLSSEQNSQYQIPIITWKTRNAS